MTSKTHKRFSVSFAIIGSMLICNYETANVNYYLELLVMISFGKVGALFPDVDHHWELVKEKTAVNWIINRIIKLTGGKHRSWQTHSLDIATVFMYLCYLAPKLLYKYNYISSIDREIATVIFMGFASGWLSHLISDMLNGVGVRLFCFSNFKVAFVPRKLFKIRFNTGNEWEEFVYKSMQTINIILGVYSIVYPVVPIEQVLHYLEMGREIIEYIIRHLLNSIGNLLKEGAGL